MASTATKQHYDVVIVGGAVNGSATAYFLANNPDFTGSVLVIERDWTYAQSATALSSSSIRVQFSNPINIQISRFGAQFIRDFPQLMEVNGDKPDLAFKENGYLFLADQIGFEVLKRLHQTQLDNGADVTLMGTDALIQRFPWVNPDNLAGGTYGERDEGWFDNYGIMNGFRKKARALGVEYIENEVVEVLRKGDRVTGVTLASGERIGCETLVNTAGTRGPQVARMAGLQIPVEPRRRSLFVFACHTPLPGVVPLTIDPTGVFFRPEGHLYLGGTYPKVDPEVAFDDFDVLHDEFEEEVWPILAERVPAFEAIKVVNSWAGHYDFCVLDHNAIVGPHSEVSNFLFCNGFSGHGLQQAPAIGRGLSELITYGEYRSLDLSPLSYERVVENRPFLEDSVI
ncbi:glycine/D-amino acid oxidase-like deaminating enzyme [Pseudomonas sp. JUb42]|uniref:NAD(P)/FAD-dependent oxidoreductase n=1 Tax=Pseudomonas sp. JUb42 TaxID=2940611 RepID=UPI0021693D34|nr:FAD-binding oxidoreductase [Pseudomonas sp. JUb42]MCS3470087.1 glycine/D-amino acid oxidase-like deaminating enzyme [Pseudomonas sp. JUb42]